MEIDESKIGVAVVVVLSFVFMIVGLIGMGICFLFIWSSNAEDVLGAGAGFISGSVLMGTSLISLAIVSSKKQNSRNNVQE